LRTPVVILFGPTASGKTEVIERLFSRPAFPAFPNGAEVISADSMQVYRGMDIGTAKPAAALRAKIPHHLIDTMEPSVQFNAGDFVRLAREAADGIALRGKLPVVSGGTGFYIDSLINGLPEAPPSDGAIREELKAELLNKGAAALKEELFLIDSVSASRIHINDTYRLLRALEVYRLTGKPLSAFTAKGAGGRGAPCHFFIAGIERERDDLYGRINRRCAGMMKAGLYEEVKTLFDRDGAFLPTLLRAIGYKEFFYKNENDEYKIIDETKLGVTEELIAKNSRNYAKRQITYFKNTKETRMFYFDRDGKTTDGVIDKMKNDINCFLNDAGRKAEG
jgi:tRNA dimethylallyltransferase